MSSVLLAAAGAAPARAPPPPLPLPAGPAGQQSAHGARRFRGDEAMIIANNDEDCKRWPAGRVVPVREPGRGRGDQCAAYDRQPQQTPPCRLSPFESPQGRPGRARQHCASLGQRSDPGEANNARTAIEFYRAWRGALSAPRCIIFCIQRIPLNNAR